MTNHFSVDSAREASEREELGAWVERFLASPGSDNSELAYGLANQIEIWTGPVEVPIREINRLAGPPDEKVLCPVDDDEWDDRVEDMADRIDHDDWEPSPLIVTYRDGELVLEDGNHRVESLRRAGRSTAWSVIGFETTGDRERFERTLRKCQTTLPND